MANGVAAAREATRRKTVTKFGDPFVEIPPELKKWGYEYYGGDGPLVHARAYPDRWHEAFLLTIPEAIMLAFGVRTAPEERPWAVRYDSNSGRYLAYPLRMLARRQDLMDEPHPWHHLYRPLLCRAFAPVRSVALRVGDAIAIASDMASQVAENLWYFIHSSQRVA